MDTAEPPVRGERARPGHLWRHRRLPRRDRSSGEFGSSAPSGKRTSGDGASRRPRKRRAATSASRGFLLARTPDVRPLLLRSIVPCTRLAYAIGLTLYACDLTTLPSLR